ncbi:MAG TPA: UDP-glucose/GDP-mannose dehydrogenase family protein [Thermoprotei archaeon]|nr:UDP-glucose/GDP-mannose dehydrogenase family protein [Thermoprotei archaeon]
MRIAVFGLGYVGTVFAASLASKSVQVIGVDVDQRKVNAINQGISPFSEPGLGELIRDSVEKGFLSATLDYKKAVESSEASFIFVGTPSKPDGSADLQYVKSAARMIGEALKEEKKWRLVVVRSTVPPGTTINIVGKTIEEISRKTMGRDFGLVMNPEFMREGNAIYDIFHPSRIIIGELDRRSGDKLLEIYRLLYSDNMPPVVRTSICNAELVKYAANAFLAMKVSFINLVARLAEHFPSGDVEEVAKAIGLDPRIGSRFLRAGLGFGGSCLPKDTRAFIKILENLGEDPALLRAVLKINEDQPKRIVEKAEKLIGSLSGKKVAVLGVAFKPNIDDVRESQSLKLINELLARGAKVVAYDPVALKNAMHVLRDRIKYAGNIAEALTDADLAIIATEWDEFKNLNPEAFKKFMKTPAVVDARRIYNPGEFIRQGVLFEAVGLGPLESGGVCEA